MKVKVFQSNHNGKIEFTRAELEKLLNEVYTDGYNEGKNSNTWTWTSPYLSTCGTSICNNVTTDPAFTLTSANCATDKIEAILDNSVATSSDKTNKNTDAKTYTVKVNGSISNANLSKLVNDIFATDASHSTSKKVENAFSKLAKELNF